MPTRAFNKPAFITRDTTTIAFNHDPEHQRFSQLTPSGIVLYPNFADWGGFGPLRD